MSNFDFTLLKSLSNYKKFIKNLTPDIIDIVGNDYTSCWLYALYAHSIHGLQIESNECVYTNTIDNLNDLPIVLNENGLYSFFHSNETEFHHFILIVNNMNITLLSTYGGQNGIICKTFYKNEWIADIQKLFFGNFKDNQIDKYKYLFGITNNINKLNFGIYNFQYSFST
jgi:hypothetical protein